MKRDRELAQKRERRKRAIKYRILCWSLSGIGVLYLVWLIWAVVQIRIENHPELGRCLLPKGTWPYQHYQNLKWVECEIEM